MKTNILSDIPSNEIPPVVYDRHPTIHGPRFGVEPAENGRYRAAVYDHKGDLLRLSDKRESYGLAFIEASKMSQSFGAHKTR